MVKNQESFTMKKEPVRIIHVLAGMVRAGTETMLMNLYRNIDRAKVQFDFAVCATKECDYDEEILYLGGRIFHYPQYLGKNHFAYKKWWEQFFTAHEEYQIVHGHIGSTASIYLSIAHRYGRYAIAHSHSAGGILSERSLHAILYKMYSFSTRYIADHFFGCSWEALVARYGKRVANDHERSDILRNAIDTKQYIYNPESRREIRKEFRLNNDDFVVGTIGRLTIQKNPYEIIRIIKLLKQRKIRFTFLWVGTGEMQESIVKKIKEDGLDQEVVMTGVRSDVEKILQAIDVFILPSLWEGMPVVSIEVQAAGLPMICSEKVSQEAKITDLCTFLPLDQPELWVDEILEMRRRKRKNMYKEIVNSGYDIESNVWQLQTFYLNISAENLS